MLLTTISARSVLSTFLCGGNKIQAWELVSALKEVNSLLVHTTAPDWFVVMYSVSCGLRVWVIHLICNS